MKVPALTPEQEATLRKWQTERPPEEPLDSMLSAFFGALDGLRAEVDLAKSAEEFAVARWKQLVEQRAEVKKHLAEMKALCEQRVAQIAWRLVVNQGTVVPLVTEDPFGSGLTEEQVLDRLKTHINFALARSRCPKCVDFGFLPNRMDAPGHPQCACGRDSVHESGQCEVDHGPVWCDCPMGVACKQAAA